MISPNRSQALDKSTWILLPLRLFLGITFSYAGIQKLTDPQFFNPTAHGYIGKQVAAFATGSPLHGFLLQVVVPHASVFGALVAYGEIAIGIGTLLGLLLRPAAFCGLLISFTFFLSATWRVYPYFYGSDIVFVFCWLTLLLAGPTNTGLPALDELLVPRLLTRTSPQNKTRLASVLYLLLGVAKVPPSALNPIAHASTPVPGQSKQAPGGIKRPAQQSTYVIAQQKKETRRQFLLGAVTGGASVLGLVWLWSTLNIFRGSDAGLSPTTATPANTASANATPGTTIAQVSAVSNNSSVNFTIASNGDPGILVRLDNGEFVAYDAVCTHAGCPVDYDPSSKLLLCPCHGAAFDPAKNASVVQGPASTSLPAVPIHVDNSTGSITVSN